MAIYIDWEFYATQYGGNAVAQPEFTRFALRASAKIDQLTFDRAAAIVTAATDMATITQIQLATCAVMDELKRVSDGGPVASERVGNYSVTYAAPASDTEQAVVSAAKLYLWNTDLMYRGVDGLLSEYDNAA